MRKSAIATTAILTMSVVAFLLDMTQKDYMVFTNADDIKKALPNFNTQQFAQLLTGDSKGCLVQGSQSRPVTRKQINSLRNLTTLEQTQDLLGNAFCQTATGLVYLTESGKKITVKIDKALDYDFDSASQSLTNKERTSKEADGSVDRALPARVSSSSPKPEREPIKIK